MGRKPSMPPPVLPIEIIGPESDLVLTTPYYEITYRCRLCQDHFFGLGIKSEAIEQVLEATFLKELDPTRFEPKTGDALINMFSYHHCGDGLVGIGDFVGMFPQESSKLIDQGKENEKDEIERERQP